ncbi:hypothetical protein GcM1_250190 [Golovinomyces cichoracearum]|uniref:Uncharacterized protein n=1 Tax=Golovinomyces cichoracearum TaxID=62708 RepID=A0A420IB65_9PEZI|nr:hypothetical protein GcM1_250190 [Golovinomyces cichoracearum]
MDSNHSKIIANYKTMRIRSTPGLSDHFVVVSIYTQIQTRNASFHMLIIWFRFRWHSFGFDQGPNPPI